MTIDKYTKYFQTIETLNVFVSVPQNSSEMAKYSDEIFPDIPMTKQNDSLCDGKTLILKYIAGNWRWYFTIESKG